MVALKPVFLLFDRRGLVWTVKRKWRKQKMKAVEIAKGVYNVGVIDWNIRDFHGYSTEKGTSLQRLFDN